MVRNVIHSGHAGHGFSVHFFFGLLLSMSHPPCVFGGVDTSTKVHFLAFCMVGD